MLKWPFKRFCSIKNHTLSITLQRFKPMNTTNSTYTPLGFSDLTQNEINIILLFREWYIQIQDRTSYEKKVLHILRQDKIYPCLKSLFVFFQHFIQLRLVHINQSEVLSPTEEYMLSILGLSTLMDDDVTERCRIELLSLHKQPRPISSIERSGYDYLQHKMVQSYQKFMRNPL